MYGHQHIDAYRLAHSHIDICVWREKRLKTMAEFYFPYLLQSVYCSFIWRTLLLSSTKFNLSLLPSRAFYLFIYILIWVPFPCTPSFLHLLLFCVLHKLHPSVTLLLKPFSTLLFCLEIQLPLESKPHPACRSHQAC